jgi:hypothetical protein
MFIMAEVTPEMAEQLKASARAQSTSVADEVGRRLERLERLEATVATSPYGVVTVLGPPKGYTQVWPERQAAIHEVHYRFAGKKE